MKLHDILSGISFIFGFLGIAGFIGTYELEPVNPSGIVKAIILMLLAVLFGLWAAYEDGDIRRKR